jgi:hypothetical protein
MAVVSKLISSNSLRKILVSIMFITVIAALNTFIYAKTSNAQMGHGHNLPSAVLGDREALLNFTTQPSQLESGKNVGFNFNLKDNNTGNNIPHVTYLLTLKKDDIRLFTESVHTHDGNMKLLFVPDSSNPYKVNANFDGLSASYISEFGSPIKVNGPLFSNSGNYSVSLEVTGIDFDNLFLPNPLEFEFNIPVSE